MKKLVSVYGLLLLVCIVVFPISCKKDVLDLLDCPSKLSIVASFNGKNQEYITALTEYFATNTPTKAQCENYRNKTQALLDFVKDNKLCLEATDFKHPSDASWDDIEDNLEKEVAGLTC